MRKQSSVRVQGEVHCQEEQSRDYEKFGKLPQRREVGLLGGLVKGVL